MSNQNSGLLYIYPKSNKCEDVLRPLYGAPQAKASRP